MRGGGVEKRKEKVWLPEIPTGTVSKKILDRELFLKTGNRLTYSVCSRHS